MEGEWITLATLGTYGGVVFAVTLVTQFLKDWMDRLTKFPTRLLVLMISFVTLLVRRYAMGDPFTLDALWIDLLNGVLVTFSAMGAHEMAKTNLKWK